MPYGKRQESKRKAYNKVCENCGNKNELYDDFCFHCGEPLDKI